MIVDRMNGARERDESLLCYFFVLNYYLAVLTSISPNSLCLATGCPIPDRPSCTREAKRHSHIFYSALSYTPPDGTKAPGKQNIEHNVG